MQDWWWKARLGKCYYQLGLLREADQQFCSSMKAAMVTNTVLELSKASAQQPDWERLRCCLLHLCLAAARACHRHATSTAASHGKSATAQMGRPCSRACFSEASSFLDGTCLAWHS